MHKVVVLVTSGKATLSQGRHDDDFTDRLNSRYTPLLLIVFTIVVTINQLVRNPITCWVPVHFTDSHQKYANNYCWIRNTYYLPYYEEIPREGEDKQMLMYYQWIQFIFLTQAILFFVPTVVWRTFNSKAGVDADNILQTANKIHRHDKEDKKEQMINYLAGQIDRFLESRKSQDKGCQCDFKHFLSGFLCRCCGRRMGNYLVLLYVFQKLLFLANIIAQFFALGGLLGTNFFTYGPSILSHEVPDHQWNDASFVAFPRVTMCDFKIRRLGNLHRYTLQCVLPLNLYIEKIYIFLWFWMVMVFVATLMGLCTWAIRFMCRSDRLRFIKNHLNATHQLNTEDDHQNVHKFLDDYLRQDGAFLLRLVATNVNHIVTREIIEGIWLFWLEKTGKLAPETPDKEIDHKAPLLDKPSSPNNIAGLTHRTPWPSVQVDESPDTKPEPSHKPDLSRAPTLYIRGNDNNSRRPNSDLYPKVKEVTPQGDSSSSTNDSGQDPDDQSEPPSYEDHAPIASSDSDPDLKIPEDLPKPSKDSLGDDSVPFADSTETKPASLYPNIPETDKSSPAPQVSAPSAPPLSPTTDL